MAVIKISKNTKKGEKKIGKEDTAAPDGQWGWIVCIGTFFANFIADGTMFSSGVQMLAFLDYFGESKGKTSWISSSQLGLSMMMGPVVSYLIAKYSVRTVTIAGGVLAFIGTIGGSLSPNLPLLILTYGVICGTGICLFFISSIVAVGLYFSRKRAIATGIAMSGSGFGVIVYSYLTELLLSVYDWRNTLIIIAALCLNACVCGALFRPLTKGKKKHKACACLEENSEDSQSKHSLDLIEVEFIPSSKLSSSASRLDGKYVSILDTNRNEKIDMRKFHSDLHLHNINRESNKVDHSNTFLSPALRKDVYYSGSIDIMPPRGPEVEPLTSDTFDSVEQENITSRSILNNYLSLFKNPSFLLLLGCLILWTVQGVTMTYVPDMAVSKGIQSYQAATLISVIGVTNTVVRILAGLVVDILHIRCLYLYITALSLGSITCFAFPWCSSFPVLVVCAIGFGICMGTVVCLRTILITDVLGIDKLTQAFGVIAFFQGLAFTVNPPIAGAIFDWTGSYIFPFLMVSVYYLLAVVLCLGLLCTRQHRIPEPTVLHVDNIQDYPNENHNDS